MSKRIWILGALALLVLSSCFKKRGVNENALLQQRSCVLAMEIHDYDRALVHCELCLEYDKTMPECLNGIGLIALAKKDVAKAREFFTKAIRQNNDFTPARNNLGVIYFSEGDFAESLNYFSQSLEIDPSNADARYNKGLSLFRLAQRARANSDRKKSLAFLEQAKEQMTKLLALEPSFTYGYRDLGLIELNRFDLTEFTEKREAILSSAQSIFETCLNVDQQYSSCYEGLAQVFVEKARFEQAFVNYFHCLSYEPDNSTCRKGIVDAFEKSSHAEGGYQKFVAALKTDPKNAKAHHAFCAELFERGFEGEAQKECEVALRLEPSICGAHYLLANYFAQVFNAERAANYCHSYLACGAGKNALKEEQRCREILAVVR